jgi:hypothetical protein
VLGTTHDPDWEPILTADDKCHVLTVEFLILILRRGSRNIAAMARIDDHITAVYVILISSRKHY